MAYISKNLSVKGILRVRNLPNVPVYAVSDTCTAWGTLTEYSCDDPEGTYAVREHIGTTYYTNTLACDRCVDGACASLAQCGNGKLEGGESCDDRNTQSVDGKPLHLMLYDIAAATEKRIEITGSNTLNALDFSPSGNHLLATHNSSSTAGEGAMMYTLYDIRQGKDVTPFEEQSWGTPRILGISPDASMALVGRYSNSIYDSPLDRAAISIADKSYAHQNKTFTPNEVRASDFKPFGIGWQYFGQREIFQIDGDDIGEIQCPGVPVCAYPEL